MICIQGNTFSMIRNVRIQCPLWWRFAKEEKIAMLAGSNSIHSKDLRHAQALNHWFQSLQWWWKGLQKFCNYRPLDGIFSTKDPDEVRSHPQTDIQGFFLKSSSATSRKGSAFASLFEIAATLVCAFGGQRPVFCNAFGGHRLGLFLDRQTSEHCHRFTQKTNTIQAAMVKFLLRRWTHQKTWNMNMVAVGRF